MSNTVTVSGLISDIKTALQRAQTALTAGHLHIAKAELEIKTVLEATAEAGFKFTLVPLDLSGKYARKDSQTISLTFVPAPAAVRMLSPVADDLTSAILAAVQAIKDASAAKPQFDLDEAAVSLEIGVTADGSIKVGLGGGVSRESTHTVKLILAAGP